MKHTVRKSTFTAVAIFAVMIASTSSAHAGASNFSNIAQNITDSIGNLPYLLSALSYMFGILLGALGVMKIKDHVENPGQTPLKDGSIRLAAGGGLLALPIIYDSMKNTIGKDGSGDVQAELTKIEFVGK